MGVFLSYRRVDSGPWTGRLYDALANVFTRSRVFMDVDGQHIEVADRWADVIDEKLAECRVLVAVIGPQWLTCTRDGRPCIEHEEDWVRREIASALQRNISVVPALVGGAKLPAAARLPADIAGLATHQTAKLDDDRWEGGVREIVEAVRRGLGAAAAPQFPIEEAAIALTLLAEQFRRSPAVAEIVGRYREALELNVRQLTQLDLYKRMHDALHDIEEHVLRMLRQQRTSRPQLVASRSSFRRAQQQLLACLNEQPGVPAAIGDELRIGLEGAARVLDGPIDPIQLPQTVEAAIAELSSLLGTLPTQLDQKIANAAMVLRGEGRLDRLADELRACAAREEASGTTNLRPLFGGLDGLETIRGDFAQLVEEHSRMQRIDAMLRLLCSNPARSQWDRLKLYRSRMPHPPSALVQSMAEVLDEYEAAIDEAFATMTLRDTQERLDHLHETFITLFHDVDEHLRDTCNKVAVIHGPLQQLLA